VPTKAEHTDFELDVTEAPPTSDQLKNILEYLGGASAASKVISGASNESDALRRLQADGNTFQRPLVVDWNSGKAGILHAWWEAIGLIADKDSCWRK